MILVYILLWFLSGSLSFILYEHYIDNKDITLKDLLIAFIFGIFGLFSSMWGVICYCYYEGDKFIIWRKREKN